MHLRAQFWLCIDHIFYPIDSHFFLWFVLVCSLLENKIYIKSIREKRLKKKKNSEWKDKKRGAHKQQPIALFVCGVFCLVLVRCYLSYLFPSLVYPKLMLGTRIGQQLGQVLWTFIQYCYLWLTCVPHTNIFVPFCAFQAPYIHFRSVQQRTLAILVPLPLGKYHEPSTGCTIFCFVLVRTL